MTKSIIITLVVLFVSSCTGSQAGADKAALSVAEAKTLIDKNRDNEDFVILDVRTPAEVDAGHIPGMININLASQDFKTKIGELDRNNTYLIYCRTQNRSAVAYSVMKEMGFTKIHYMLGGFREWASAGHETE